VPLRTDYHFSRSTAPAVSEDTVVQAVLYNPTHVHSNMEATHTTRVGMNSSSKAQESKFQDIWQMLKETRSSTPFLALEATTGAGGRSAIALRPTCSNPSARRAFQRGSYGFALREPILWDALRPVTNSIRFRTATASCICGQSRGSTDRSKEQGSEPCSFPFGLPLS